MLTFGGVFSSMISRWYGPAKDPRCDRLTELNHPLPPQTHPSRCHLSGLKFTRASWRFQRFFLPWFSTRISSKAGDDFRRWIYCSPKKIRGNKNVEKWKSQWVAYLENMFFGNDRRPSFLVSPGNYWMKPIKFLGTCLSLLWSMITYSMT